MPHAKGAKDAKKMAASRLFSKIQRIKPAFFNLPLRPLREAAGQESQFTETARAAFLLQIRG